VACTLIFEEHTTSNSCTCVWHVH